MTKKQIIISVVVFVILLVSIICVSIWGKHKREVWENAEMPEIKVERRHIETSVGVDGSEELPGTSTPADTTGTNSSTGGSLYQKTYTAAPPETSGYPVPKNHHFYQIEGSLKPSDPHQAELAVYLDCDNFEKQLKELEETIQPILGPDVTKEIVAYMRTKTSRSVGLDKWWETDNKKINIGSGYGSYIIEFLSWKKQ